MDLSTSIATVAGWPVLRVSGEIDLATVPQLRDAIIRLVTDNAGSTVLVDLDGVGVLDDSGLGVLLGGAARAREFDGDLVLVASDTRLRSRFALSGLDRAIEVHSSITGSGTD